MAGKRWLVLLAAVLAAALTARLGVWQLDRAAQKIALQTAIDIEGTKPPLANADLGDEGQLHRRVILRGRWLAERTVWLDNRPMDGHTGFFVVTPLLLTDSDKAILVQRGWAPRNQRDRTQLPPLATPSSEVTVQGRLAASPSRLFDLGEGSPGAIRQNLDPAAFAVESGLKLLPLTVVQTAADTPDDTLLRHWPAPDLGLQKHYGYAFQWFALCALIVGLYVWFQLLRPRFRQQP